MNRWLLIWNLVLTISLTGLIVNGCASMDPEFTQLASKVASNRSAIEQLTDAINEHSQLIQKQALQAQAFQLSTETSLQQFSASLQDYIEKYVDAQLKLKASE